jgi:2-iminobutanoate/2-iminopropanoate deaminase
VALHLPTNPLLLNQNLTNMKRIFLLTSGAILSIFLFVGCNNGDNTAAVKSLQTSVSNNDTAEYFLLRPELEKAFGYSHAVRIGNDLKISGAVSMNDNGEVLSPGDMEQQMKNCYADLEKILKHHGYTFDDVVVENVFTTNMEEFLNVSGYRNTLYKKNFPTGTWLEVKGLALKGLMIEIDMEAHKSK